MANSTKRPDTKQQTVNTDECRTCYYWRPAGNEKMDYVCHFCLDTCMARIAICKVGECKKAGVWKPKKWKKGAIA